MHNDIFIEISGDNFNNSIDNSNGFIIFYKNLCPHCKVMSKVLEKIIAQDTRLKVFSVDSEKNSELMEQLNITRVPSICSLHNGKITGVQTGIKNPKETILFYNSHI